MAEKSNGEFKMSDRQMDAFVGENIRGVTAILLQTPVSKDPDVPKDNELRRIRGVCGTAAVERIRCEALHGEGITKCMDAEKREVNCVAPIMCPEAFTKLATCISLFRDNKQKVEECLMDKAELVNCVNKFVRERVADKMDITPEVAAFSQHCQPIANELTACQVRTKTPCLDLWRKQTACMANNSCSSAEKYDYFQCMKNPKAGEDEGTMLMRCTEDTLSKCAERLSASTVGRLKF